eukprot:341723-Amphidinium_carterae.2
MTLNTAQRTQCDAIKYFCIALVWELVRLFYASTDLAGVVLFWQYATNTRNFTRIVLEYMRLSRIGPSCYSDSHCLKASIQHLSMNLGSCASSIPEW